MWSLWLRWFIMTSAIILSIWFDQTLAGKVQWGEKVLTQVVRQMEPWSLSSAVLSHSSVCFLIWLQFLLIYLTNYLKMYWVPMTYTKMEKNGVTFCFRRSQSVGENQQDEFWNNYNAVYAVWIKYPLSDFLTPFAWWGQHALYFLASFIRFYFSDKQEYRNYRRALL